jgi:type I restriction enzyme S subunit
MKHSGIEWIGDIPSDWEVKKIKHLFQIIHGSTPESNNIEYWDGNIPWITPADMVDFGIISKGERTITKRGYNSCGTSILPKGSIIISTRAPVGKINITQAELCTNQGCKSLVSLYTHTKYYFYLLYAIQEELVREGKGTTFIELGTFELGNFNILLPSLSEQSAIANFLDTHCSKIDSIIAELEQQIELLKQYKISLITETITKGMNKNTPMKNSGIDWIGKIPTHWEVIRLKFLLETALLYGANEAGIPYENEKPRYIRITDITHDGNLKNDELLSLDWKTAKPYILKNEDILFARSGATVGKTFYFESRHGVSAFAGYLIKASIRSDKYYPKFIYYYTLTYTYEIWKTFVFTQATIQNIAADKYANCPIICPSLSEQNNIATFLDSKCKEITDIITEKQQSIDTMKAYKKSLIYEYVTGKKRVKSNS